MRHPHLFESLETRRLLAGNVTAVLNGAGVLVITGDNKSNQIDVEAGTAYAGYTIAGLNGTTVNGGPSAFVPIGPPDVAISMGNGDDSVRLHPGPYVGFDGYDITIDTGNGADNVEVTYDTVGSYYWLSVGLSIDTGNGNDNVVLSAAVTYVDLNVSLGNGADTLTCNFYAGSFYGNVNLNGGNGPDTLIGGGGFFAFSGSVNALDFETII